MKKLYRIVKVPTPGTQMSYIYTVQRKCFWLYWVDKEYFNELWLAENYIESQRTRLSEVISEHEVD